MSFVHKGQRQCHFESPFPPPTHTHTHIHIHSHTHTHTHTSQDKVAVANSIVVCEWISYFTRHFIIWSSGRVQDSGLGSRSSPEFNTLPVRLLVVPLSKALHAALLLSTQEEMGTCEGRFVSRGAKLRVSGCILPRQLRWLSIRIWTVKGPMTREGTCQSLQSRALSLDVDSKQWLYLYFIRYATTHPSTR